MAVRLLTSWNLQKHELFPAMVRSYVRPAPLVPTAHFSLLGGEEVRQRFDVALRHEVAHIVRDPGTNGPW